MSERALTPVHFRDIRPDYDINWLVQDLLGVGDMSCIFGPPGATKSFFALDMALHISLGWTWMGKAVTKGAVVYVSCEGGRRFVHRVEAFRRQYEEALRDIPAPPFGLIASPVDLLTDLNDIELLATGCMNFAIECGEPLRMIIIDTVSRALSGGDENGPKDMGMFVKHVDILREVTRSHILLIHHTGKDINQGGRGHNSLKGALDTEILVMANGNTKVSMAKVVKQKDGEDGGVLNYKLIPWSLGADAQGLEVRSCALQFIAPPPELTTAMALDSNPLPALVRQHGGAVKSEELFVLWAGNRVGHTWSRRKFGELCAEAVRDELLKEEGEEYVLV